MYFGPLTMFQIRDILLWKMVRGGEGLKTVCITWGLFKSRLIWLEIQIDTLDSNTSELCESDFYFKWYSV